MSAPIIWYFVKFFKEEKYADAFMRGEIRLNRLSHFRDMEVAEDCEDDGRPDRHEAVSHWWQTHDINIHMTVSGIGEINIGKDDLAAPVFASFDYHSNLNILCLYSVRNVGFHVVDGRIHYSPEQEAEVHKQLFVDERNFKFGEFAVIAQGPKFAAHMKKALQGRGQFFKGGVIEYYDDAVFHGGFKFDEIPFRKQHRYSYQNEYRIIVDTKTVGDAPLDISVGDMSEFCIKVPANTLNKKLQFSSLSV